MNFEELYPSRFISAATLGGKSCRAVIKQVTRESIGTPPVLKAVAMFTNGKEMVLNKTNAARIALAFGKKVENWCGREIELYEDHVEFAGKIVPALRVRTAPVTASTPTAPATAGGEAWEGPAEPGNDNLLQDDIPWN